MEILSVKHKGDMNRRGFGKKAFFNLDFPALGLVLSLWSLFISNSSPQSWRSSLHLGGVASTVDRLFSCQVCAQSLSVPLLRLSSPQRPSQSGSVCHPSAGVAKGPDPLAETTMHRVRLLKAAQQPEWAQLPLMGNAWVVSKMSEGFMSSRSGGCPNGVTLSLWTVLSHSFPHSEKQMGSWLPSLQIPPDATGQTQSISTLKPSPLTYDQDIWQREEIEKIQQKNSEGGRH